MQFKYSISEISVGSNFVFSILRKKHLFNNSGNEIKLADSEANYRCTLTPSLDINKELLKIWADGEILDYDLLELINKKLKPTLQIWWTPEVVVAYEQALQGEDLNFT